LRTKTLVIGGAAALTVLVILASEAGQRNRVSPHESVGATIDGAALKITYGRPSVRGRAIFGVLVPYDKVWCPGADEATTLESDKPLRVGTLTVPPMSHTIWMLPTADAWTLIVSKEPNGFHTRYHAAADLGRVPLQKTTIDAPAERLTFAIEKNAGGPGGTLSMTWDTTRVSTPFTVLRP